MEYREGQHQNSFPKMKSVSLPVFQFPRSILMKDSNRNFLPLGSVSENGVDHRTSQIDDYLSPRGTRGNFRLPTITCSGASDNSSSEDDYEDDYVDLSPGGKDSRKDYDDQTLVKLPKRYRLKVWGYGGVEGDTNNNPEEGEGGGETKSDSSTLSNGETTQSDSGSLSRGEATKSDSGTLSRGETTKSDLNTLSRVTPQGACTGEEDEEEPGNSVEDRERDLQLAIKWIRQQVAQWKQEDKALLRQFLELRSTINQLRGLRGLRTGYSPRSSSGADLRASQGALALSWTSLQEDFLCASTRSFQSSSSGSELDLPVDLASRRNSVGSGRQSVSPQGMAHMVSSASLSTSRGTPKFNTLPPVLSVDNIYKLT